MKIFGLVMLLGMVLFSGCGRGHQDERRYPQVTCVNNLKVIGIAFRIWAGDHGDKFPFNVSTNEGGTMELCSRDKDGFDANAYLHFQVMSNELKVPRLLVCPDSRTEAATKWNELAPANITYRLRTGTNVIDANPRAILVVCPVDGNTLYCDGTVVKGK